MNIGSKLYLKKNVNVYAKIISQVKVHRIPHFQISIYRCKSITEACVSKYTLEQFYQFLPINKKSFIEKIIYSMGYKIN